MSHFEDQKRTKSKLEARCQRVWVLEWLFRFLRSTDEYCFVRLD